MLEMDTPCSLQPAIAGLSAPVLLLACWLLYKLRCLQVHRRDAQHSTCSAAMGVAAVPPIVAGVPLLGNVLALNSRGAAFLQQCHKQHGDAFTLKLLGQRMTFVFAPATLQHYFSAADSQLTFAPAVQQFTHRVFGLPPQHFYHRHMTMLQALRNELVPSALPRHTARLASLLVAQLEAWPATGQLDLWEEVKRLVFQSSVTLLFGPALLQSGAAFLEGQPGASAVGSALHKTRLASPASGSGSSSSRRAEQLQRDFFAFEAGFEMAASPVPHLFQPSFLAARRRLLAALRTTHKEGLFKGTVAGYLIEACGLPGQYVPNMLLAVLWAAQANAVPAAFWSLGFLLLPENRQHMQAVVQEAQQAVAAAAATPGSSDEDAQLLPAGKRRNLADGQLPLLSDAQQRGLVALAANRRSAAAAAVSEALRLRSFSIDVRIAAADSALPCGQAADGSMRSVWVQKGDVVAISPYECHLDPRLFQPSAHTYDPHRQGIHMGGSAAAHTAAVVGVGGVAGLSFGGGKYRCPGRAFAETEIALITSLLLLCFDWQLLPREATAAGSVQPPPRPPAERGTAAAASAEQQQQQQQRVPGDPGGLLPPPDLRRLVGIKVPSGPCWVQFQRRALPA